MQRWMIRYATWSAFAYGAMFATTVGHAASVVAVTVPGAADPWLAGMPDGSTASLADIAPAQSPAEVFGLNYSAGGVLTFSVTGSVSYFGGTPTDPPDGEAGNITGHLPGAENGMSNVLAPFNALMGVFLSPGQPNLLPAPGTLDFSTPTSRDYLTLSPLLQQVFFIGDGLTSSNIVQQIAIPAGATRFFLGSMDEWGWYNNSGAFSVQVTGPALGAVPEPASLSLLAVGLLATLAYCLRGRAIRGRCQGVWTNLEAAGSDTMAGRGFAGSGPVFSLGRLRGVRAGLRFSTLKN